MKGFVVSPILTLMEFQHLVAEPFSPLLQLSHGYGHLSAEQLSMLGWSGEVDARQGKDQANHHGENLKNGLTRPVWDLTCL